MSSIELSDDILAPRHKITLNYRGKNPFTPVHIIPGLFKDIMKITSKDVFEKVVKWDITSDPKDFYIIYFGYHEEDRWTYTLLRVTIIGAQSSTDKTGWIKLDLEGRIVTKFDYANFLQKTLWFLFNRSFYYKQRRRYLERGKDWIFRMRKEILSSLNIYQGD